LVALQALGVLCTYQLGEELEALLPVQIKLHLSANHNGDKWLLIVQEKRVPLAKGRVGNPLDRRLLCRTWAREMHQPREYM
jgi:hypothetical protein